MIDARTATGVPCITTCPVIISREFFTVVGVELDNGRSASSCARVHYCRRERVTMPKLLTYREAAKSIGRTTRAIRYMRQDGMPMGWDIRHGQRVRVVDEQILLKHWPSEAETLDTHPSTDSEEHASRKPLRGPKPHHHPEPPTRPTGASEPHTARHAVFHPDTHTRVLSAPNFRVRELSHTTTHDEDREDPDQVSGLRRSSVPSSAVRAPVSKTGSAEVRFLGDALAQTEPPNRPGHERTQTWACCGLEVGRRGGTVNVRHPQTPRSGVREPQRTQPRSRAHDERLLPTAGPQAGVNGSDSAEELP